MYIISNIVIVKNVLKSFSGYLPDDNSKKMDTRKCSWVQGLSKQLQVQPLSNIWSVLSQDLILQLKFQILVSHTTLLGKKVGGGWPPRPPQFCRPCYIEVFIYELFSNFKKIILQNLLRLSTLNLDHISPNSSKTVSLVGEVYRMISTLFYRKKLKDSMLFTSAKIAILEK